MCTGYIWACLHIKIISKKDLKSYNEKKCSDMKVLWNSYSGTAIPEQYSVKLQ